MFETFVNVIAWSAAFESVENLTEFGAKRVLFRALGFFSKLNYETKFLVRAISQVATNSWGPVAAGPTRYDYPNYDYHSLPREELDTVSWG